MYNDEFEPPRSGRGQTREVSHQQVFVPDPPTTRQTVYRTTIEEREPEYFYQDDYLDYERVDCTPGMCAHPYALFRWFQMAIFFTLHWLIQITCARTTCTMILTEFGYKAYGQAFILCVIVLLASCCSLILIAYSMNMHKARPQLILPFERIYALLGVVLMVICGVIGTYHAVETNDPEINALGRGESGIKPQWIAAAVIEFLTAIVFVADLIGQNREGFPFVFSRRRKAEDLDREKRQKERLIREQKIRESYY